MLGWRHGACLPGVSWQLRIEHPTSGMLNRSFERTAEVWAALSLTVAELEREGFVAGELEVIRYGEHWLQMLAKDAASALIHVQRVSGV